jgi:hypothetical protein
MTTNKWKYIIDIAIFLGFLISMDPHSTGNSLHEWISTAAFAAAITHLLLSWQWIVETIRRTFTNMKTSVRISYTLNVLLFIAVTLVMFTGFMLSRDLLPVFGITVPENFAWRSLHDMTANLSLLLIGIHLALHWNWIVDTTQRFIIQPISRLRSENKEKVRA